MLNFKSTGKVKTVDTQHPDDDGNVETYCELTQAEYDALSVADKNNGVVYYITDSYGGYTPGQAIINLIYPVGSIYLSINAANPSTLFGGTWVQIQDTFLLAAGSTYTAGSTGGEATHILTGTEMPIHAHNVNVFNTNNTNFDAASVTQDGTDFIVRESGATVTMSWKNAAFKTAGSAQDNVAYLNPESNIGSGDPAGITSANGGNQPHNNMPPYLAVYVWKRTA